MKIQNPKFKIQNPKSKLQNPDSYKKALFINVTLFQKTVRLF